MVSWDALHGTVALFVARQTLPLQADRASKAYNELQKISSATDWTGRPRNPGRRLLGSLTSDQLTRRDLALRRGQKRRGCSAK